MILTVWRTLIFPIYSYSFSINIGLFKAIKIKELEPKSILLVANLKQLKSAIKHFHVKISLNAS